MAYQASSQSTAMDDCLSYGLFHSWVLFIAEAFMTHTSDGAYGRVPYRLAVLLLSGVIF